ncbi:hypothetical protein DFS33DRAFT_1383200 [Desarmillaria ectypa]|nr:hypothetical protein DFS33DRAFT_1383200 [Desarmillaria ectypa]
MSGKLMGYDGPIPMAPYGRYHKEDHKALLSATSNRQIQYAVPSPQPILSGSIPPSGECRWARELQLAFGFSRRLRAGLRVADATLFITIARALAVFDISNAIRGDGVPIKSENDLFHPEPFSCSIDLRYPEYQTLLGVDSTSPVAG